MHFNVCVQTSRSFVERIIAIVFLWTAFQKLCVILNITTFETDKSC